MSAEKPPARKKRKAPAPVAPLAPRSPGARALPRPVRNATGAISLPTVLRAAGRAATRLANVAPDIPLRDAVTLFAGLVDISQRGAGGGGHPLARLALGLLYSPEESAPLVAKLDAHAARSAAGLPVCTRESPCGWCAAKTS